jgi:hypothetical protein
MALVNCKECNKEISSKAKNCPHCGVSIKSSNWFLYAILIVGFIIWTVGSNYEKNVLNSPENKTVTQAENDCNINQISIHDLKTQFKNFCRSSKCIALTGTVTIENLCTQAVGVQVKVTTYDKNNNPIQIEELWPASIRNIQPGKESFSTDHWIKYEPAVETIDVIPIRVKVWQ